MTPRFPLLSYIIREMDRVFFNILLRSASNISMNCSLGSWFRVSHFEVFYAVGIRRVFSVIKRMVTIVRAAARYLVSRERRGKASFRVVSGTLSDLRHEKAQSWGTAAYEADL
jgi:hypothetical protein